MFNDFSVNFAYALAGLLFLLALISFLRSLFLSRKLQKSIKIRGEFIDEIILKNVKDQDELLMFFGKTGYLSDLEEKSDAEVKK